MERYWPGAAPPRVTSADLALKDLEEDRTPRRERLPGTEGGAYFEFVIPNYDGEDSDNWEAFYCPLGDARRAFLAVVAPLRGESPTGVERWEEDLLP